MQLVLESQVKPKRMTSPSSPPVVNAAVVDPCFDPEWDRAVATHADATIFHTRAWAEVLKGAYGHRPFYLRLSVGGKPAALLPVMEVTSLVTGRRGVSVPFSDFCSPLFFDLDYGVILINKLIEVAAQRGWKYFEFRGPPDLERSHKPSATYYSHTLDTGRSSEELFAALSGSARRAIRKAERGGLSINASSDRDAIARYYQLHARTRRRQGLPPQPYSFFEQVHEHIISRGLGFVMEARSGSRPAAAAVFFQFGKNALYKFGASDVRLQHLRANNLVMWEAIKLLARNKLSTLHFGRTAMEHEGLRQFKLSFGAKEEMSHYFKFTQSGIPCPGPQRQASALASAVFRRLPLTVNRFAGTVVYPHLD